MVSLLEWSKGLGPADMTVDGLAKLEAELFRPYPDAQRAIEQAVAEFKPEAQEIERRHDGRRLMRPVQARHHQNLRSNNVALATVGFLILLLTTTAFGAAVRGPFDHDSVVRVNAAFLAIAAVGCIIKLLSTLRDRVWVGVTPLWAVSSAVLSIMAALVTQARAAKAIREDLDNPLVVIYVSTAVIVAFGVLALIRHRRARRELKGDLAGVQPKVDAYMGELGPAYAAALARITSALEAIDPKTRTRLRQERDLVVNHLVASRGLTQGEVPPLMNKKALGEFQLFAVAEPMLGGGPYPTRGRPRTSA